MGRRIHKHGEEDHKHGEEDPYARGGGSISMGRRIHKQERS